MGLRSVVRFLRFEHVHCGFRQALLIGGASIRFCHFERIPTENRHQLMRRRAIVGSNGRASFAQAMRRTMAKSCLIAPIAELVSEPGIREGPSEIVHEERELAARRCVDYLLQHGQHRQNQPFGLAIATLKLRECDLTAADVLAPEARNVRPSLSREEQKRERKTCLGPYRVTLFELSSSPLASRCDSRTGCCFSDRERRAPDYEKRETYRQVPSS